MQDRNFYYYHRQLHPRNKTGYPGISWDKKANKYRATIMLDYRQTHLGLFDTPEEANAVRERVAREAKAKRTAADDEAVHRYIYDFIETHGHSPSLGEIGTGTTLTYLQVRRSLARLDEAGLVAMPERRPRTVAVLAKPMGR